MQLPVIEEFTDVQAHEVLNIGVPPGAQTHKVSHKELPHRDIPSTGLHTNEFLNTDVAHGDIPASDIQTHEFHNIEVPHGGIFVSDVQTMDIPSAHVQVHQIHNTDALLSDVPSSGDQTHKDPETHLNSDAAPATDKRLDDFQTHHLTTTENFDSDIQAHQVPVSHVPLTDAATFEKISNHDMQHKGHEINHHRESPFNKVQNADAQADLVPETHVPAEIPHTGVPSIDAHAHGGVHVIDVPQAEVSFNDGPSREASFSKVPVSGLPTEVSSSKHHASPIPDIKTSDTVRRNSDVLVGEIPTGTPTEDIQTSEFSSTGLPIAPETHVLREPQNQPTSVRNSFRFSSSSLSQDHNKEEEEPEAPVTEMSFTVSFKETSPVSSTSNLYGGFLQPTPPSFSSESQQPLDQIVALQDPGQHLLGDPKRESKSLQGDFETDTTSESSLPGTVLGNSPSETGTIDSESDTVPLETTTVTPDIYETTLGTTAATLETRGAAPGRTNTADPGARVNQETKEFTPENAGAFLEAVKIVPENKNKIPENIRFTPENPDTALNHDTDGFEPVKTITTTTTTKTSNANLLPSLQSKSTSESFSEPTSKSTVYLFLSYERPG